MVSLIIISVFKRNEMDEWPVGWLVGWSGELSFPCRDLNAASGRSVSQR